MQKDDDILSSLKERYENPRRLAAGTGGVVYRVFDKLLAKDVAIKLLLQGNAQERILRFQQEAKAAGKLKHQNVIKVLDFGVVNNQDLYLVMECVDGVSLADYLKSKRRLPLREAVAIFDQIAEGMAHAHSNGVLHRDLKPSNVILVETPSGKLEARILDFGLALLRDDRDERQSISEGRPVGSPLYMAPEQADALAVDERSDIYSLGCLMCQCLTGEPPYRGETVIETLMQHQEKTIPRLQDLMVEDNNFPEEMEQAVERCLQKRPDDRFQSMNELRAALATVPLPKEIDATANSVKADTVDDSVWSGRDIWERARTPVVIIVLVGVIAGLLFAFSVNNLFAPPDSQLKPEDAPRTLKPAELDDHNADQMDAFSNDVFANREFAKNIWTYNAIPIVDKDFEKLADRKDVSCLFLQHGEATGAGLRYIKDKSQFEAVTIYHLNFGRAGFEELVKFKNIERLRIRYSQVMTDADVALLTQLPKPVLLYLNGDLLTDKAMSSIARMKTLHAVSIEGMRQITDEGLARLIVLPQLNGLAIGTTGISDKGLSLLSRCRKLQFLDVRNLPVSDANIKKVALPTLRALCLKGTSVTIKGIAALKACKHLGILDVRDCKNLSRTDIVRIRKLFPAIAVVNKEVYTTEYEDDFIQLSGRLPSFDPAANMPTFLPERKSK